MKWIAKNVGLLIWLLLVVVVVLVILPPAWADDDDHRGTVMLSGGSQVDGDTSVTNSSKAFAFSHSLGDVDINDCLASTQWGTILVSAQKVNLNKWCAGEVYDAKGLYTMAALVRCDIPEIRKFFEDDASCVEANTVEVYEPIEAAVIVEEYDEHDEELEQLSEQVAILTEQANRPRARQVVQQPYLSDAKKAALAELVKE